MTISNTARGQVFQQEGGGFLELLVITHANLSTPIRLVNNTENVVSNGETYIAYPFKVGLPKDKDRTAPSASLTISNVTRELSQLIRQISTPPAIDISIIRIDDLDAVEVSYPTFYLRNVKYDVLTISGELSVDDMMREPYPQRTFTPSEYPGMF